MFLRLQAGSSLQPLLTFDDGHMSNYEYALPLLQRYGLTGHFFITSGWTGKRRGYMHAEHLRALQKAGQHVGAHGWSHVLLTNCTRAELHRELYDARLALEDHLSAPVKSLSLPGGRSNAAVLAACEEAGYSKVWTSSPRAESLPLGVIVGRYNVHATATDSFLQDLLASTGYTLRRVRRYHQCKLALQQLLGDSLYSKLWVFLNRAEQDLSDRSPTEESIVESSPPDQ